MSTGSNLRPSLGERLVHEHAEALWAFAVRHVAPQLAEDLIQDTLLAALRAADSFEGRSAERTWILAILSRKIADHFRRRARSAPLSGSSAPPDEAPESDFTPSGRWKAAPKPWPGGDDRVDRDVLSDCLERLPNILRDAVELRDVRGLPNPGVCQALGISATNLWQRLHRARLAVRRCVEQAEHSEAG